jgi:hypothetical protein
MPKPKDKAEEREEPRPKKPPGFRKFQKLLKKVVNVPPLKSADAMAQKTRHRRPYADDQS